MNSGLPKQFLLISGLPVLIRSIRPFFLFDPSILIIIALPASYHDYWKDLCEKYNFNIQHQVVEGGDSRFLSVKNALQHVPDDCLVAIHDGVRPLVSQKTISRVFQEAERHGNAIPVVPFSESVRKVTGTMNEMVDRSPLRIVQTPQVFQAADIKKAYSETVDALFTDDAVVLESSGARLNLVEGNPENIKITLPSDLLFAEAIIMKASLSD
jgi:2-C-methyl-D-erythritol 4-phosphate cytidylyltransferase